MNTEYEIPLIPRTLRSVRNNYGSAGQSVTQESASTKKGLAPTGTGHREIKGQLVAGKKARTKSWFGPSRRGQPMWSCHMRRRNGGGPRANPPQSELEHVHPKNREWPAWACKSHKRIHIPYRIQNPRGTGRRKIRNASPINVLRDARDGSDHTSGKRGWPAD